MLTNHNVTDLLPAMSQQLNDLLERRQITDPLMIGILSGGAWIAKRLHPMLSIKEPMGTLGITFYRDDFTRIGMHPEVRPSDLPFDINGRHIILVDDVLHTGRTIRAAMNEIFDFGRPASIILSVLIKRNGQELPIHPDITGRTLNLDANEQVKLFGPDNLRLSFSKHE